MVDVLEYPCTVVVKIQDKGHLMLSDALNRLGKTYVEFRTKLGALATTPLDPAIPLQNKDPAQLQNHGLWLMEKTMLEAILKHLKKCVRPLLSYDSDSAQTAMALLCDPRHRRGEVFFWMCDSDMSVEGKKQKHKQLVDQYTDLHLIPAMAAFKRHRARLSGAADPSQDQAQTTPTATETTRTADVGGLFKVPPRSVRRRG